LVHQIVNGEVVAEGLAGDLADSQRVKIRLPQGFCHTESAELANITVGFVPRQHLMELQEKQDDYVQIAASLLGTPYKWGGRDSMGLDCSALIQHCLHAAGIVCPRDSGPQQAQLGSPVSAMVEAGPVCLDNLQRGDILFFKGHVGLMLDNQQFLHANAWHMQVAVEPLNAALPRLQQVAGPVLRVVSRSSL